jgi:hypothetical protein
MKTVKMTPGILDEVCKKLEKISEGIAGDILKRS